MSDENNGVPPSDSANPPEQDPFKNVKSEFNRKIDKTNELVNQLLSSQAQLQEALQRIAAPPASSTSKNDDVKLEELMYSDPKKYTEIIQERATQSAVDRVRSETHSKDSVNQTIAQLASEYPELSDQENELTKAAAAILKGVSEADRTNPRTYEYAVMKAARELDVKPRSKRAATVEDDGFVAPSYSSPQARSKKRSSEQVVTENREVGRAFGVDLDDPKTKERYLNLLKSKGRA